SPDKEQSLYNNRFSIQGIASGRCRGPRNENMTLSLRAESLFQTLAPVCVGAKQSPDKGQSLYNKRSSFQGIASGRYRGPRNDNMTLSLRAESLFQTLAPVCRGAKHSPDKGQSLYNNRFSIQGIASGRCRGPRNDRVRG